ncbi:MAG: M3 family peptidase, partial [Gammaproteobacteria bacterium]|nr:M3 family peptidase [Gammaproteobacteria bacterium]
MRKVLFAIMTSTLLSTSVAVAAPATPTDPLLAPWSGPYGGVPPFDKVETKNLGKAIESAIALHLAELDAIANDPA